jgi:hypothetical protein
MKILGAAFSLLISFTAHAQANQITAADVLSIANQIHHLYATGTGEVAGVATTFLDRGFVLMKYTGVTINGVRSDVFTFQNVVDATETWTLELDGRWPVVNGGNTYTIAAHTHSFATFQSWISALQAMPAFPLRQDNNPFCRVYISNPPSDVPQFQICPDYQPYALGDPGLPRVTTTSPATYSMTFVMQN